MQPRIELYMRNKIWEDVPALLLIAYLIIIGYKTISAIFENYKLAEFA